MLRPLQGTLDWLMIAYIGTLPCSVFYLLVHSPWFQVFSESSPCFLTALVLADVILVTFVYDVFAHVPDKSYRKRFASLFLWLKAPANKFCIFCYSCAVCQRMLLVEHEFCSCLCSWFIEHEVFSCLCSWFIEHVFFSCLCSWFIEHVFFSCLCSWFIEHVFFSCLYSWFIEHVFFSCLCCWFIEHVFLVHSGLTVLQAPATSSDCGESRHESERVAQSERTRSLKPS